MQINMIDGLKFTKEICGQNICCGAELDDCVIAPKLMILGWENVVTNYIIVASPSDLPAHNHGDNYYSYSKLCIGGLRQ